MMNRIIIPLGVWAAAFCVVAADLEPTAPGARLEKLAGDFSFTEGPAADAQGNVYFTDQPNDRILKWSVGGGLSTYLQPCGRANGLTFDREGNLWACADEKNELWRISPDGKKTVVLKDFQGKLFNGPNDIWICYRPSGVLRSPADTAAAGRQSAAWIYFTDPYYKRPYWNRGPKELPETVYLLEPRSGQVRRVIDDLKQPNGIIGTPDGKTLYVADIGAKKTYRYRIAPDGALENKTLFCELGSDGMTIDEAGNVYLTGKGVSVFNPEGRQIAQIDVPEPWTANVCFGGADRRTLFITASKGLYSMRMRVRGVDSQ
ncbi:MAG TPA: SMP-30/gluconolactonase/LRE family protein [Verrucomicrobiota bacterium]|jgi:gluconolactonase|nr:SMP-30/gluconolactonase/LRE family protein [Verrucomicrobiota bacterium]HRT56159.1 SMP-30/gluconolactonase/LRE family protein [Candidatus Paceibacterota bacterium]